MEQILKYQELYTEFADINDFNLAEKAKQVPAQKHWWVARLIDAEIDRQRLLKQRNNFIPVLTEKLREKSKVALNERELSQQVNESPSLEALNIKIQESEMLIKYLDKVVNQITYIAQDIKNIIEIQKLETL